MAARHKIVGQVEQTCFISWRASDSSELSRLGRTFELIFLVLNEFCADGVHAPLGPTPATDAATKRRLIPQRDSGG
jgi:hypothetical protein